MDATLRQLGELVLRSIPTIIVFLIVYSGYRLIFHNALVRVLDTRYQHTEGAMERARADIAAAEAKTAEYEQRLREARASLFRLQETRRQQALQARSDTVRQAREQALGRVAKAKAAIEQDMTGVRAGLQAEAERLARQIVDAILKPAAVAQTPVGGPR